MSQSPYDTVSVHDAFTRSPAGRGAVAEVYQREVEKLFASYPPGDAARSTLHDDIRKYFRDLATFLLRNVPASPELWRSVQELHVAMMLANAAVAANWETVHGG